MNRATLTDTVLASPVQRELGIDRARTRWTCGVNVEEEPAVVLELEEAGAATSARWVVNLGMEAVAVPEVAFVLVAAALLAAAVWAAQPQWWPLGLAALPLLAAGVAGLHGMSPNKGAVLLFIVAAASLAMEVYSLPGLMLHAAGGAIAVTVAGLFLQGPEHGVHPGLAVPTGLVVALGTWSAALTSWRATRVDPLAESTRLVGRELVVLQVVDDHTGRAVVAGQMWHIRDTKCPLRAGAVAHVRRRCGDELLVRQRSRSQSDLG